MIKNIKRSWLRWLFCVIICSNGISYGINRYMLVPIQDQLIDFYNIDALKYNLLMSLYSWPNVFFSIFCGILVDKFGVRKILTLSWSLNIIGLFIVVYSAYTKYYISLCIGRTIVGIANEALSLTVKLYAIEFFNSNEYAIVFGIYLSAASFGAAINNFITYRMYTWFDDIFYAISFPLMVAPITCFPLFMVMFVEKIYYNKLSKPNQDRELTKLIVTDHDQQDSKENKFQLSDIKGFSRCFWILLLGFIIWSGQAAASRNIAISFIHHMFQYSYDFATIVGVFERGLGIIIYLFAGKLAAKIGRKCEILLFANMCGFIGEYIYGWIHGHIFWVFCGGALRSMQNGFTYPIVWAALPILVVDKVKGTAFGFATASRFACIGTCYVFVGILTESEDGPGKYTKVQIFLLSFIVVSTIIYIVLYYMDIKYNDGILKKVYRTNESTITTKQSTCDMYMQKVSFVSVGE
eukprot:487970_1